MQIITDYTRDAYRDINRSLLNGIVSEQAAQLIEAISDLPAKPGTTYRTFWVDDLEGFIETLKARQIVFEAFTSTSRSQYIAGKFRGNVRLTIEGYSGRDIAPYSDAPNEVETLYLPGRTFRVRRVKVQKIAGKIGVIEADLVEL